jgi:hypothetical protein
MAVGDPVTGHRSRTVAAAVPLILVNVVAFGGQLAFLRSHLHWPLAGQVIMAVALESVAVFLALHAHVAALANDSALRLRLSSYAFAAVIGAMNYSHWSAPGWRPTFPAVATGLMSAASPWLWAVHSRRVSRDQLLAAGLVEPHALRLGATRWMWHPLRSARVMYHATWEGISDPRAAIAAWEARHGGASRNASRSAAGSASVRVSRGASRARPRSASGRSQEAVTDAGAEMHFAADLAGGQVPSVRRIQRELHVGAPRARSLRQHMEALTRT